LSEVSRLLALLDADLDKSLPANWKGIEAGHWECTAAKARWE
jgi:hypothetical protein